MRHPTLAHYGQSLSLLTDLYQLTMAYGYWQQGMAQQRAVFHLTFRRCPFRGHYAVACGAESAVEFLERLEFDGSDLDYLASLRGNDERPLFADGFLNSLRSLRFQCDVDVVPEGTPVFAHEPLLRVSGPLLQAQLIETPLLNLVNFQTLAATKASRVCRAARGGSVLEFGLRRAQGVDGGLAASRAAYVGGCAATSNVLAGKLYGIPVRGTHAHSWVMAFEDELESFRAYAAAMPNNSLFLVDTYDTVEGVRKAAQVGRELAARGHRMLGIRLDSGDLGPLSRQARRILDEAGFPDAMIVASNDLDEHAIDQLLEEGAEISVWGVGTKLATCYDQPALGGVYKLSAIADRDVGVGPIDDPSRLGESSYDRPLRPVIKLSEQSIKTSNPTSQQVRRLSRDGRLLGDIIYSEGAESPQRAVLPDGAELDFAGADGVDLLQPAMRRGVRVREPESLETARQRCLDQLQRLPSEVLSHHGGTPYPVGLSPPLHELKQQMIRQARQAAVAGRDPG